MELTYRRSTARSSSTSSVSMAMSFGSAPPLLPHLSVALLLAFSSSHHLHHHEFSVIWRRISLQTQKRFKKAMQFIRYVKLHIMIREFAEFSLDATQYSLHSVPIIRSWEDKVGSCLLGG